MQGYGASVFIQTFTHALAHFEKWDGFSVYTNRFARARITANTGFAFPKGKGAKAAKLYTITALKGLGYCLKDRIYQLFKIAMI